jgi:cytochrome c peroxidase
VVDHYTAGIKNSSTLDPALSNSINLTNTEKENIIKFLKTLTDWSLISNHLLNR